MKTSLCHKIALFVLWLGLGCTLLATELFAAQSYPLRSAKPDGSPVRVTAKLELGGHLKISADKKADAAPMSVVAQYGYDEQRLDDGASPNHRLAARYYDDVQVVLKVANGMTKPLMRESRRLIIAATGKEGVNLSSPHGPLSREDLDLIDIPANTLILDELLPQDDVETGHRWKPTDETLARLLGLDAVGHTEVECLLVDVQNGTAEITIDGSLGGAIDGVAAEIELKGKLLFDIKRQQPQSLLLAIKEQRGIGHVGPGLDVVAKLKLTISPLLESKLLTSEVMQEAKLPQTDPGAPGPPLEYVSETRGFRFLYDRRWRVIRDEPDLLVLRLVDRGDLIAQCNIAPAIQALDKPVDLAKFQADVQEALGKLFGRFERASERGTDSGLRILQAIAAGMADDLPIQWRYYLVHNRQGRALSVVFTLETPLAEQFGNQDKPLVESVEFLEPKAASRNASGQQK